MRKSLLCQRTMFSEFWPVAWVDLEDPEKKNRSQWFQTRKASSTLQTRQGGIWRFLRGCSMFIIVSLSRFTTVALGFLANQHKGEGIAIWADLSKTEKDWSQTCDNPEKHSALYHLDLPRATIESGWAWHCLALFDWLCSSHSCRTAEWHSSWPYLSLQMLHNPKTFQPFVLPLHISQQVGMCSASLAHLPTCPQHLHKFE